MKIRAATIAAVLLLALTGCTDDGASTSDESTDRVASVTDEPTAGSEETASPEPLVAQDPGEQSDFEKEAAYLEAVHDRLSRIQSQIPDATDEQLLAAADDACRLANDTNNDELSLIDGETKTNGYYMDSSAIIISARMTICPIG